MPINYDWRGNIKSVSAKTVADAKQTIQELRFKNREYAAQKKEVSVLIAQVRSHGRARIAASRSTTLLLGRSTDRVVKNSIKASKDIIQMQTNNEIRKIEEKKMIIENNIIQIDACILNLQQHMARN